MSYGSRLPVTDTDILEAAELANARDFIESFRAGLDTQASSRALPVAVRHVPYWRTYAC
jgi:ABC-type multidrug transport system fused ATPase/permease subunit